MLDKKGRKKFYLIPNSPLQLNNLKKYNYFLNQIILKLIMMKDMKKDFVSFYN